MEAFVTAFQRGDHFTTYWLLSREAQEIAVQAINDFDVAEFGADLADVDFRGFLEEETQSGMMMWAFWVQIMESLDRTGHPVAMDGQFAVADTNEQSPDAAEVIVAFAGAGSVRFATERGADGKWRVRQVRESAAPDDSELIFVDSDGASAGNPDDEATSRYYDLDLSTPEAATDEMFDALRRADFLTMSLTLHPDAQRNLVREGLSLDMSLSFAGSPWESLGPVEEWEPFPSDVGLLLILFDAAAQSDLLLIDASDGYSVGEGEGTADEEITVVPVTLDEGRELHALVMQTPDGRWRVRQLVESDVTELESDYERLFFAVERECAVGPGRYTTRPGFACGDVPLSFVQTEAFLAEVRELEEAAGDDINLQLAASQQIANLYNRLEHDPPAEVLEQFARLCVAMQGDVVIDLVDADVELVQDALEGCPGDPTMVE